MDNYNSNILKLVLQDKLKPTELLDALIKCYSDLLYTSDTTDEYKKGAAQLLQFLYTHKDYFKISEDNIVSRYQADFDKVHEYFKNND